ncbi:hypothetical protein Taro_009386 [Colocasia esculenta]|uniref:Uncharacterized protein n=1 Tax=Colocasia esculenta TaxID=4460 RepID=A0A843U0A1_COLES|nr:hypothetical protein [Colocasia esculenta]
MKFLSGGQEIQALLPIVDLPVQSKDHEPMQNSTKLSLVLALQIFLAGFLSKCDSSIQKFST